MGLAEVAKITIKDKVALDLFDKVNETAHNLDKMLMKLQSISDLGVQELIYKELFIDELFKRELDLFSEDLLEKNIRIEIKVEPTLSFYSYPALVKIVIQNLIENAISFCGSRNPLIWLSAYKEGGEVVIIVEDNGQGIEGEYVSRVFDMYFRGNERSKGNGLGLYIVKKTADKIKARLKLDSVVGKGTKISIFFPLQLIG
jgi:signal transduction histidine kinase